MSAAALPSVLGVLGSCMSCMVVVEKIAKTESSAMNLMTFSTFTFIALHGLIFTSKFLTVPIQIPLQGYVKTVVLFFVVNVVNNLALSFHVPVPLHIIFRSGTLLANLLLSVLLMGKTYSMKKYLSVFSITVGIIVCTLATSAADQTGMTFEEASKHYREWLIGIGMLTFALLAAAYLSICQTEMFTTYGKHPEEAMFVTHAVSLPLFSLFAFDISASAQKFSASEPLDFVGLQLPSLWVFLLLSCFLQFFCIRYVYRLNSEVDSLTVTLVVTLRKFLSLIVSIVWFQNPFTLQHWMGASLVFAGTIAFTDFKQPVKEGKKKD